jgi:hypothetical protein
MRIKFNRVVEKKELGKLESGDKFITKYGYDSICSNCDPADVVVFIATDEYADDGRYVVTTGNGILSTKKHNEVVYPVTIEEIKYSL